MAKTQRVISAWFVSCLYPVFHIFSRPGDTTINAQYTIDPNQNGGLDYQYDLVVRNRDERRRLDAGDCECCREVNTEYSLVAIIDVGTDSITRELGLFLLGYNLHSGVHHRPRQPGHVYVNLVPTLLLDPERVMRGVL